MSHPTKSIAPGPNAASSFQTGGVTYACEAGSWLTVPIEVADILLQHGWIEVPSAFGVVSDHRYSAGSTTTISLTASQINHMFSAPVALIAAPGVGKMILPTLIELYCHAGTVPFRGPFADAGYATIMYQGANGPVIGNITIFESSVTSFFYSAGVGGPSAYTDASNQPLILTNNTEDYVDYGAILTSSITAGGNAGSGYAVGDTGTVSGSYGVGTSTYQIDTVDGDGAVLTYHLTDAGHGYKTGTTGNPTLTGDPQAGSGSGLEIDVNSITPGDGSGTISITYKIVTLP